MQTRLDKWLEFLSIDESTADCLIGVAPLLEKHIDSLLDTVYEKILSNSATQEMFADLSSIERAKQAQRHHWIYFVLRANFGPEYLVAARRIGETHYRLGVDLRFYLGTYTLMTDLWNEIVLKHFRNDCLFLQKLLSAISRVTTVDMGMTTAVYYDSQSDALRELAHELNFALARAGEFRDNETGRHLVRMSKMCRALAKKIGMEDQWAEMLEIASPLHDVGKIGIPDNVLLKPGALLPDEIRLMRTHPSIGATIIPDYPAEVIKIARRVALTHHEKWDGTGYPSGLKKKEIPLEGRIAAICDVYDALVSARPYKEPWTSQKATHYIQERSGQDFDPDLVEAFLAILPEVHAIQIKYSDH
ncbi:two-component system response regulator [Herbaspirillum sp. BH-1]|nr:two-component system response regulator [Herbaspirillum sp. BH-1]